MKTTKEDIEELLKPRWKVVSDFPGSNYIVGNIYIGFKAERKWFICPFEKGFDNWDTPQDYPAIFKKLEWWEERTPDEFPKYVRWKKFTIIQSVKEFRYTTHNLTKETGLFAVWGDYEENLTPISILEPATEEEFKNSSKKSF